MAEKNIAALLDERAHTVGVVFSTDEGVNQYTYVTDKELLIGDVVIVPCRTVPTKLSEIRRVLGTKAITLKLAVVVSVDKMVDIPANDDKEYAWVIDKVVFTDYYETMDRNDKIEKAVARAYQTSLRRSFADRILGELGEEDKSALLKLLGK